MTIQSLPLSLICLLFVFVYGCSDSTKKDPTLEKAFQVHQQSLKTAKEARELLEKIPAKDESVSRIQSRLENWNENLIEVPGFEHEHNHEDGDHHHHHHGGSRPTMDLSPEDMLAVQQQLLDTILAIKKELLATKEDIVQ